MLTGVSNRYHGINEDTPTQGELDVGWHSSAEKEPITGGSYHDIQINHTLLNDPDFTCGQRYQPGPAHALVEAGSIVTVTWCKSYPDDDLTYDAAFISLLMFAIFSTGGWGTNHRGGVFDYLAACNGDCDKSDRSLMQWFKIGELGMIEPHVIPHPQNDRWNAAPQDTTPADRHVGYWATDLLDDLSAGHAPDGWESPPDHTYMENSPWTIQIPQNIKPGKYILRTEIYALFGGTQLYPRCVNLEITGSGTEVPAGVPFPQLYNFSDPTATVWFQDNLSNWTLQGPALYSGAANPNPNLALGHKAPPGPDVAISASQAGSGSSSSTPSETPTTMTGTSGLSMSSAAEAQGIVASGTAYSSVTASSSPSPTPALTTGCPEPETTTVVETFTVTVRKRLAQLSNWCLDVIS